MKQQYLFEPIPTEKFDLLTKEELIILLKGEQNIRIQMQKEVERLQGLKKELDQKSFFLEDQLINIKNKLFGKSSERSPKLVHKNPTDKWKTQKTKVQLPSLRYPNAPLIERDITLEHLPNCGCCGHEMEDSGMTEDSEYLTTIPQQYLVIRQKRHKYRCGKCHGDIKTTPVPPRIKEGSSYSDDMMIDVAMTKYCDLIPIERYSSIAGRAGLEDLPPQSLIEATHYLADFLKVVYQKLRHEILASSWLHADETPHRMLEGDDKCKWYLWGFSNPTTSYFECHDTRSGDVASDLLINSKCNFLVSDVFSGYGKAVRVTNESREQHGLQKVLNVYCNAHVRRKFKEAEERFPEEVKFHLREYRKIYRLEKLVQKYPDAREKIRIRMRKYFEKIRDKCISDVGGYSSKSSIGKAMYYYLNNYDGLTEFLNNSELPIDNNPQERLLRNPVIGRKTWYGTHSKRGAETAAALFSLVESCKLNQINPREYLKNLVQDLHQGKEAYTPKEFRDLTTKS